MWRWLVGIALVVVAALAVFYFIGGNGGNEEPTEMTMDERVKALFEQYYNAAVQGDVDKFRDIYDDFSKLANEAELKGCLTECEQAAMEWIEQNDDKVDIINEFYEGIYCEPEIEQTAECCEEMICYDEWAEDCEVADGYEVWAEAGEADDEYDHYYECVEAC